MPSLRLDDWREIDDGELHRSKSLFEGRFRRLPTADSPNESQTEDDLIWPFLLQLGWTASLRQQNSPLTAGRTCPTACYSETQRRRTAPTDSPREWKRYEFGLAVVESKRWLRPLDRRSGRKGEENAPSTQMLRYLRRVDDLTNGNSAGAFLPTARAGGSITKAPGPSRSSSSRSISQCFSISPATTTAVRPLRIRAAPLLKVFLLVFPA